MSGETVKENEDIQFNIDDLVAGYKIVEKIDEGGFGKVFKVTKDGETYAMKIESNAMEGGSAIKLEIDVLVDLQANRVSNFPSFVQAGRREKYHYLVMELLGDNLKALRFKSPNPDSLSVGTWTRIGMQCLCVVKLLHENGFIHRDIKPANFAMGRGVNDILRGRMIFLFDFGLARRFVLKNGFTKDSGTTPSEQRSKKDKKELPETEIKDIKAEKILINQLYRYRIARPHTDFRGTQMYASPNAHAHNELGRGDDVWSLMYMIAEMTNPLPWATNEDFPIEEQKNKIKLDQLFNNSQFEKVEEHLRNCNYYMSPDYEQIYNLLKGIMEKSGSCWNDPYDWETDKMPSFIRWKEEKAKKQITYNWEEPKDFFRHDPWKYLINPVLSGKIKKEKEKKQAEKSGAKESKIKQKEVSDKKIQTPILPTNIRVQEGVRSVMQNVENNEDSKNVDRTNIKLVCSKKKKKNSDGFSNRIRQKFKGEVLQSLKKKK